MHIVGRWWDGTTRGNQGDGLMLNHLGEKV